MKTARLSIIIALLCTAQISIAMKIPNNNIPEESVSKQLNAMQRSLQDLQKNTKLLANKSSGSIVSKIGKVAILLIAYEYARTIINEDGTQDFTKLPNVSMESFSKSCQTIMNNVSTTLNKTYHSLTTKPTTDTPSDE